SLLGRAYARDARPRGRHRRLGRRRAAAGLLSGDARADAPAVAPGARRARVDRPRAAHAGRAVELRPRAPEIRAGDRRRTVLKHPLLEPFQHMPDSIPAAERERLRRAAADLVRQHVAPALRTLRDYLANEYIPHARESIAISDLPDGKAWYAYLLRYYTTTDL